MNKPETLGDRLSGLKLQLRVGTGARAPTIGEQMRGFTPEDLARISQALASFIGPIAKIIVQKASTNAKSYGELCVRVSERLTTEEERARFLAQVGV